MAISPRYCLLLLFMMLPRISARAAEPPAATFYAAPASTGSADGSNRENAAPFHDLHFWQSVQSALFEGPVDVCFIDGNYSSPATVVLTRLGHPDHRLLLLVESPKGVVFSEHTSDTAEMNTLLGMRECRNVTLRHFNFTGPGKMAFAFHNNNCENLLVEQCTFIDLVDAVYGAAGTAGYGARNVTYRDCDFSRVGDQPGAHMLYNGYGSRRVNVINCRFTDCAGEFVRFCDDVDYCVVAGCTFEQTGNYKAADRAFISMPGFQGMSADDIESSPSIKLLDKMEYFGSNYLFFDNTFISPATPQPAGEYCVFLYHHSGFSPRNRTHWLTPEDAERIATGSREERLRALWDNLGIDLRNVHVFNNRYVNPPRELAVYRTGSAMGSPRNDWAGRIDIFDLFNDEPVVGTIDEALEHFARY